MDTTSPPHARCVFFQEVLVPQNLAVKSRGIQRPVSRLESLLRRCIHLWRIEDPLVGCLWGVVMLFHPRPIPSLLDALHRRQEKVHVIPQYLVKAVEKPACLLTLESRVPYETAHNGPVLLLHVAVVVLPLRSTPRKGNAFDLLPEIWSRENERMKGKDEKRGHEVKSVQGGADYWSAEGVGSWRWGGGCGSEVGGE